MSIALNTRIRVHVEPHAERFEVWVWPVDNHLAYEESVGSGPTLQAALDAAIEAYRLDHCPMVVT
jgi:hypothetical protein